MPHEYLKVEEVAEKLRCSRSQIRKLMLRKENPLPFIKVSSRMIYISSDDLMKFMTSCAMVK